MQLCNGLKVRISLSFDVMGTYTLRQGLIALDRLGIVHRDVSYSNLMLPVIDQDSDGPKLAKIIDLGLAHVKDIQSGDEPPSRVPGTPSSHQEWVSKSRTLTDKEDSPSPDPRAHHHITVSVSLAAALHLPNRVLSLRERSLSLPWT